MADAIVIAAGKAKKPMFGDGAEDEPVEEAEDDLGPEMDKASMEEFISAVQASDAEAALAAWRKLPCPEVAG